MDSEISRQQQIEQLIRASDHSRSRITEEVHSLKAKLDVPARVRGSLKGNPTGWMLGSAASGLFASLLLRRRKTSKAEKPSKKKSSHPIKLLALILTLVRPMAKVWLTGQLKNYLAGGTNRLASADRR